jgi:hypothetical protein
MSNLTAEYFIQKLSPIPENKWIVGQLENKDGTERCTAGWLGGYFHPETSILGRLFTKHFANQIDDAETLIELHENPYEIVFAVNDSDEALGIKITGTSPKQRVMNVLYQIRKKELQDGNIAKAKEIINAKSGTNVKKTSARPKYECVSADY